ncbi:hypothetical protein HY488_00730 [Candidatus Woesearchaeota archaeon]|nr:hypothetical protein [Candidatus Woesearchaeota archaeon]
MALKQPESMDECIYFTRRTLMGTGKVMAWVFKQPCPKCKKAMMGKPVDEKGHVKIRAKEYVCPACKYTVEKSEYEDTLTCDIIYTCPKCKHQGETSVPFKRKAWQGVKAIVFECGKCKEKLGVTKKMKEGKKKSTEEIDDEDDF